LNFWRALTDNDRLGATKEWRKKGLDALQHRIDAVTCEPSFDQKSVCVSVEARIAPPVLSWGIGCTYVYTIYGSGDVVIEVSGEPQGEGPKTFPRVGLQVTLPKAFERVTWYGRGPGESYSDSKQANRIGLYRKSVDELFTPYVYPQENGNRTDVNWVAITNTRGAGLLAVGAPQLDFSAHRYTTEALDRAQHTYELEPQNTVTLHLDYAQNGIGSASCGPGVLPQYELQAQTFHFSMRLKPFSIDQHTPMALSKQIIPPCE